MRKEVKLKGCILRGHDFVDGLAVVVGGGIREPFCNIYNEADQVVVAFDKTDMDRLVKAWIKARGGFPA